MPLYYVDTFLIKRFTLLKPELDGLFNQPNLQDVKLCNVARQTNNKRLHKILASCSASLGKLARFRKRTAYVLLWLLHFFKKPENRPILLDTLMFP
jgi:hypothetical protein